MSTADAPRSAAASTERAQDGRPQGTLEPEVNVHNCNRLGRTANPPRFSITNWFRFGRRR